MQGGREAGSEEWPLEAPRAAEGGEHFKEKEMGRLYFRDHFYSLLKSTNAKAALPGEVSAGSQEEVSIQEPLDKRETQGPALIRKGASIAKMGLRSQKSKVRRQRSLYFLGAKE